MRGLEQPAASLRVEHVEAKGAEVGEGLIGRPTGVGQRPQCPTLWGQLFLDNWAMQEGLGRQAGGKGDKGIQVQIVGLLRHHSGQNLCIYENNKFETTKNKQGQVIWV